MCEALISKEIFLRDLSIFFLKFNKMKIMKPTTLFYKLTHTRKHTHTQAHVHTNTHVQEHACTHTHIHRHTHQHTCTPGQRDR